MSLKTISSSIVLRSCLFGETKITNRDEADGEPQKYKYSGYGIAFDRTGQLTHLDGSMCRNVAIFGVDINNSKHTNNKTKNILVLGHDLIQKIDDTTIYAETMYSPNFSVENKTFCYIITVIVVICLLMAKKSKSLKQKTLKLMHTH